MNTQEGINEDVRSEVLGTDIRSGQDSTRSDLKNIVNYQPYAKSFAISNL